MIHKPKSQQLSCVNRRSSVFSRWRAFSFDAHALRFWEIQQSRDQHVNMKLSKHVAVLELVWWNSFPTACSNDPLGTGALSQIASFVNGVRWRALVCFRVSWSFVLRPSFVLSNKQQWNTAFAHISRSWRAHCSVVRCVESVFCWKSFAKRFFNLNILRHKRGLFTWVQGANNKPDESQGFTSNWTACKILGNDRYT